MTSSRLPVAARSDRQGAHGPAVRRGSGRRAHEHPGTVSGQWGKLREPWARSVGSDGQADGGRVLGVVEYLLVRGIQPAGGRAGFAGAGIVLDEVVAPAGLCEGSQIIATAAAREDALSSTFRAITLPKGAGPAADGVGTFGGPNRDLVGGAAASPPSPAGRSCR